MRACASNQGGARNQASCKPASQPASQPAGKDGGAWWVHALHTLIVLLEHVQGMHDELRVQGMYDEQAMRYKVGAC